MMSKIKSKDDKKLWDEKDIKDNYAVACNLKERHKYIRKNSLCYIAFIEGTGEKAFVATRMLSGKIINVWLSIKKIYNFRIKFIKPMYHWDYDFDFGQKKEDVLRELKQVLLIESIINEKRQKSKECRDA